jgi:hypothetical protein
MLDTLGEVVTLVLAIVAVIVVPAAIARAWWSEIKRAATNTIGAVVDMFVMTTPAEQSPRATDTSAVHVPVLSTDTGASTAEVEHDITPDHEMPRIGRRLSDAEIVAVLALQKGSDGARYRFSANQIYELVKGPRAEVLAQIRAIREGPPAPQVREHQARLEQLAAVSEE